MCNWLSILIISKTKPSHSNQEDLGDDVFENFFLDYIQIRELSYSKVIFQLWKNNCLKIVQC